MQAVEFSATVADDVADQAAQGGPGEKRCKAEQLGDGPRGAERCQRYGAEDCAEYLVKGQEVGISARLQWREWDASDGSGKRQAHELIAHRVDFLRKPKDADSSTESDVPADAADLVPAGAGAEGTDDIPF